MTNFSFLSTQPTYAMVSPACIEAKRIFVASPAMCAVGCRKELELAVKWVYVADTTMQMPQHRCARMCESSIFQKVRSKTKFWQMIE